MRQRTRITAAIMTGVSATSVFYSLGFLLSPLRGRGSLFDDPYPAVLTILGWLVNVLSLAGWIYLLKNRVWAWTMLIWLTAISAVGLLCLALASVTHVDVLLLSILFVPIPFGWANIPALFMLVSDKPSGWSRQQPAVAPCDEQPGCLKNRTRIIAWIYLVISGMGFIGLPLAFLAFRHRPGSFLYSVPTALVWILWAALLRGRTWAWWTLVAAYTVTVGWYVWGITQVPAYYAAHHKALAHPWQAIIPTAVMLVLIGLIPLCALLTDRPSRWTRSKDAA